MQSFSGVVIRGSQRAALLGYPTINIELKDPSVSGIFAAKVMIDGIERIAAAFADSARGVLEANILDVSDDFYGKDARIDLYKKLRDNQRFENDQLLKMAMASDVELVRAYFA